MIINFFESITTSKEIYEIPGELSENKDFGAGLSLGVFFGYLEALYNIVLIEEALPKEPTTLSWWRSILGKLRKRRTKR